MTRTPKCQEPDKQILGRIKDNYFELIVKEVVTLEQAVKPGADRDGPVAGAKPREQKGSSSIPTVTAAHPSLSPSPGSFSLSYYSSCM